MNILFVCSGNTCRSPMAEGICRELLSDTENVNIASIGITANTGEPAAENAVAVMAETGIDISSHRARGADRELLSNADKIYVMNEGHLFMLTLIAPDAAAKAQVLGSGINDPYGGDIEVYRACRDEIREAIEKIHEDNQI